MRSCSVRNGSSTASGCSLAGSTRRITASELTSGALAVASGTTTVMACTLERSVVWSRATASTVYGRARARPAA